MREKSIGAREDGLLSEKVRGDVRERLREEGGSRKLRERERVRDRQKERSQTLFFPFSLLVL